MGKGHPGGFTLLELAVVMSLMGVVGLSFAHLYVNSHRYLAQGVLASAAQGEASYAVEHIKRYLLQAVNVTRPLPGATSSELDFRVRWNAMSDPPAGILAQYRVQNRILEFRQAPGNWTPVARNITGITFTRVSLVRLKINITAQTMNYPGGDAQTSQLVAEVGLRGMS